MARWLRRASTTKAQYRRITPLTWAFFYGADDGNRTRVFSLGSRVTPRGQGSDLLFDGVTDTRRRPLLTALRGTPGARRPLSCQHAFQVSPPLFGRGRGR